MLRAVELPPGSVLESNGILKIGNVTLSLRAATSSWSVPGNAQWRNLKSEAGSDLRNFSGEFEFSGVQAHASETVRRTGPNKYRIEGEFKFASPVFANAVFADFDLPLPGVKLLVDGKAVIVPEVAGNPELFDHRQVRSIRVEMPGGTAFVISGKLRPRIQDNRKYNGNSVSIRLACIRQSAPDGLLNAAKIEFDLEILPSGALPVELGKVANGGVPDFPPPGELKFNGFPFRIRADGKTVAVGRGVSAEQVKLPLPGQPGSGGQSAACRRLESAGRLAAGKRQAGRISRYHLCRREMRIDSCQERCRLRQPDRAEQFVPECGIGNYERRGGFSRRILRFKFCALRGAPGGGGVPFRHARKTSPGRSPR